MRREQDIPRPDFAVEGADPDSLKCEDRESFGRTSIPFGFQNLNTGEIDFFEEIRLSYSLKKQPSLGQPGKESESADSTSRSE
jgi:hypothetical protein